MFAIPVLLPLASAYRFGQESSCFAFLQASLSSFPSPQAGVSLFKEKHRVRKAIELWKIKQDLQVMICR